MNRKEKAFRESALHKNFPKRATKKGQKKMEAVTTGVENVLTIAGTCLTTITTNPLLMLGIAFPLVGAGIAVVRKLIHS